jgi:hypothetical protein
VEVATFYVGAGLHPYLRACLQSWSDHGHQLDVYTYDRELALPPGARRRDATEILPSERVFTYRTPGAAGSVAAFANEFRYRLLAARPVLWVDTDVLCLRDEWPVREYCLGWETSARTLCNNAVLGLPRGSEILTQLCDVVEHTERETLTWGETGPRLITRLVTELGLRDRVAASGEFFPIHHSECRLLFDPQRRAEADERVAESLAVHLWDEIWTRRRVPTFVRPPRGSYLEWALARHGVEIPVAAHFSDLDSLDAGADVPLVPQADYDAVVTWAHSLERDLLDKQAAEMPIRRRRWPR